MTAPTLQDLLGMLRAGRIPTHAPVAEQRTFFDGLMEGINAAASLGGVTITDWNAPRSRGLRFAPAAPGARTVLYFHSGGHVVGSPHGHRAHTTALALAGHATVISVRYALAPEAPFPRGFDDALNAYEDVLNSGVAAAQVCLVGVSAGGGLVLGLLLAARARGLPLPAGACLLSSWHDLALSGASMQSCEAVDAVLSAPMLRDWARLLVGDDGSRDPRLDPLSADMRGLPPLLIQVGSDEVLLDDSLRLAALAARARVDVSLRVWPNMPHAWQLLAPVLLQGRLGVDEMAAFLRQRLGD